MERQKVTIEAVINASADKVWNYWTLPEHITHWNFASDDWHCPRAENDVRAGGKMNVRMEAKDGSFGFDFEAIYDEVVALEKISYSLGDGRQVVTTFAPADGGTLVKTVFDAEKENPVEMQQAGWQSILNNFKAYVQETEL